MCVYVLVKCHVRFSKMCMFAFLPIGCFDHAQFTRFRNALSESACVARGLYFMKYGTCDATRVSMMTTRQMRGGPSRKVATAMQTYVRCDGLW